MLKSSTRGKANCQIQLLPHEVILPNPHQPRKNFNWDDLEGLAESIHYNGLLQPITVRKKENGRYPILDISKNSTGDTVIISGDGKGNFLRYTFFE